jgi:hypothetical protein
MGDEKTNSKQAWKKPNVSKKITTSNTSLSVLPSSYLTSSHSSSSDINNNSPRIRYTHSIEVPTTILTLSTTTSTTTTTTNILSTTTTIDQQQQDSIKTIERRKSSSSGIFKKKKHDTGGGSVDKEGENGDKVSLRGKAMSYNESDFKELRQQMQLRKTSGKDEKISQKTIKNGLETYITSVVKEEHNEVIELLNKIQERMSHNEKLCEYLVKVHRRREKELITQQRKERQKQLEEELLRKEQYEAWNRMHPCCCPLLVNVFNSNYNTDDEDKELHYELSDQQQPPNQVDEENNDNDNYDNENYNNNDNYNDNGDEYIEEYYSEDHWINTCSIF